MSLANVASVFKKTTEAATKLKGTMDKVSDAAKQVKGTVDTAVKTATDVANTTKDAINQVSEIGAQVSDAAKQVKGTATDVANTTQSAINQVSEIGAQLGLPNATATSNAQQPANPLAGLFQSDAKPAVTIPDDDIKKEILKAYLNVIEENKELIQNKMLKSFDTALTHITSDKYVDDRSVKEYLHNVIFNQIDKYYKEVDTIYVQHIFLKHIFKNNKDIIIAALTKSIRMKGDSQSERERNILNSFRNHLAEHIISSFEPTHPLPPLPKPVKGGDSNVVPDKTTVLTQISKWFPIDADQTKVSWEIAYMITQLLPKYINDIALNDKNPHYKEFNTKLSTGLNAISANITNTIHNVLLEPNTPELDIALLHASLSIPNEHYMKDTVLACIREYIGVNTEITDANASDVAYRIYDSILLTSDQMFRKTLAREIPTQKGGRRRLRSRKTRKHKRSKTNKTKKR